MKSSVYLELIQLILCISNGLYLYFLLQEKALRYSFGSKILVLYFMIHFRGLDVACLARVGYTEILCLKGVNVIHSFYNRDRVG